MAFPLQSSMAGLSFCTAIVTSILTASAFAQTVPTFDDAPSMEQLRAIMVPESRPGAGRTIVMQPIPRDATPSPVQKAAAEAPVSVPPVSVSPVADTSSRSNTASTKVAVNIPTKPSHAPPANGDGAGVVGFHIKFAFDSATLPESAYRMIDRIAQLMQETPQLKLRVEGHTDATGAPDYNISLSERRALAVLDYLRTKGIDTARLVPIGKGMTEPADHNPYDPGNRRVQFVRIM